MNNPPCRLLLSDGSRFEGFFFTSPHVRTGEVVFNTALTGYQEVVTDPSYTGQMVVMTYPMIGSYGVTPLDSESSKAHLRVLICKEYIPFYSNWRATQSLGEFLDDHQVVGITGVDTRTLTRRLRDHGSLNGVVAPATHAWEQLADMIGDIPTMVGQNLTPLVSTTTPYRVVPINALPTYRVAVIDTGVKRHILNELTQRGCACDVLPVTASIDDILGQFDGVMLANGPGDPEPVESVIHLIQQLLGKLPIFGICLGHQLLWLALGGQTYKLKFGHHAVNHPVRHLATGRVEMTSQNHGFCIDIDSLPSDQIELTHINLNDQTPEGFRHRRYPAFSVQYHPESAPGPHDSTYLFDDFVAMMQEFRVKGFANVVS